MDTFKMLKITALNLEFCPGASGEVASLQVDNRNGAGKLQGAQSPHTQLRQLPGHSQHVPALPPPLTRA